MCPPLVERGGFTYYLSTVLTLQSLVRIVNAFVIVTIIIIIITSGAQCPIGMPQRAEWDMNKMVALRKRPLQAEAKYLKFGLPMGWAGACLVHHANVRRFTDRVPPPLASAAPGHIWSSRNTG